MRVALCIALSLVATGVAGNALGDEKKVCSDAYVAAQALRDEHHLVAAREQLRVCARQECATFMQGQIVKDCASWLAQVEAAIPAIIFEATDGAGNDLSAVRVTMDGAKLLDRLDGAAVAVDPGEHTFVFEGNETRVSARVVVRERDKGRRVSVVLRRADESPGSIGAGGEANERGNAPSRWPVYAAFGVAGASLAAAIGYAFVTSGQSSTSDDANQKLNACGSCANRGTLQTQADDARQLYHVDLGVALGLGAVALVSAGVGTYLLVRESDRPRENVGARLAPWIGLGSAGLVGRF